MKVSLNLRNTIGQKHEKRCVSVSAYVYMMCDTPLSLYAPVHILDDPLSFLQLRKYLMDGLPLNQKSNKNIRISYLLKYKHSKKNLYEKINGSLNIQGSSINQKPNSTVSVMLCTFVKKNSCLVARIISFDTVGLHLLTFRILELYSSKDIELDISHVASH